jgi:hypothetical protein
MKVVGIRYSGSYLKLPEVASHITTLTEADYGGMTFEEGANVMLVKRANGKVYGVPYDKIGQIDYASGSELIQLQPLAETPVEVEITTEPKRRRRG